MLKLLRFAAPKLLCIYDEEGKHTTLQFLKKLDSALRDTDAQILIDLSLVELASASASVILFAFINRAQLLSDNPSNIRIMLPKSSSEGYRWIVQTGLSKALFAYNRQKLKILQDTNRFFQSPESAFDSAITIRKLLTDISESDLPDELMEHIEIAISEAILNVSHHAYEDRNGQILKDEIGPRWWQCAWSTEEENVKTVVFIIYDVGQGINSSYTTGRANSTMTSGSAVQQQILAEAMSLGRTRFGENSGRGKGSEDIKYAAQTNFVIESELLVVSGSCAYNIKSNQPGYHTVWLQQSLPGTLLEWSFSIKAENGRIYEN